MLAEKRLVTLGCKCFYSSDKVLPLKIMPEAPIEGGPVHDKVFEIVIFGSMGPPASLGLQGLFRQAVKACTVCKVHQLELFASIGAHDPPWMHMQTPGMSRYAREHENGCWRVSHLPASALPCEPRQARHPIATLQLDCNRLPLNQQVFPHSCICLCRHFCLEIILCI